MGVRLAVFIFALLCLTGIKSQVSDEQKSSDASEVDPDGNSSYLHSFATEFLRLLAVRTKTDRLSNITDIHQKLDHAKYFLLSEKENITNNPDWQKTLEAKITMIETLSKFLNCSHENIQKEKLQNLNGYENFAWSSPTKMKNLVANGNMLLEDHTLKQSQVNELGKMISHSGNVSSKINSFDFIKDNGKRTGKPKDIKDHFLNGLENNNNQEFMNLSSSSSVTGMEMNMTYPTSHQSEFDDPISSTLEISNMSYSIKELSTVVNDINSTMFNTSHKVNELGKMISHSGNVSSKINKFDFIKDNGERTGKPKYIKDNFFNVLENNIEPFAGNSLTPTIRPSRELFGENETTVQTAFIADSEYMKDQLTPTNNNDWVEILLYNLFRRYFDKVTLLKEMDDKMRFDNQEFLNLSSSTSVTGMEMNMTYPTSHQSEFDESISSTLEISNISYSVKELSTVVNDINSTMFNTSHKVNELGKMISHSGNVSSKINSFEFIKDNGKRTGKPKDIKDHFLNALENNNNKEFMNLSSSTSVTGMEMNMTYPTSHQSEFDDPISSTLEISNMSYSIKELSTVVNDINSTMFNTSHKVNELGKMISHSGNVSSKINNFDFIKDNGKRTGKPKYIKDNFFNVLENNIEPFAGNSLTHTIRPSRELFGENETTVQTAFIADSEYMKDQLTLTNNNDWVEILLYNLIRRYFDNVTLLKEMDDKMRFDNQEFLNLSSSTSVTGMEMNMTYPTSHQSEFDESISSTLEISNMSYSVKELSTVVNDINSTMFNTSHKVNELGKMISHSGNVSSKINSFDFIKDNGKRRGKPKDIKDHFLNALENNNNQEFMNLSSSTSVTGMEMNMTYPTSHQSEFDDPISSTLEISNMSYSIKELSTVVNDINSTMFNTSHKVNELGKMISHSGNVSSKINKFDFIKDNGERTGKPKYIKDNFFNVLENNIEPFAGNSLTTKFLPSSELFGENETTLQTVFNSDREYMKDQLTPTDNNYLYKISFYNYVRRYFDNVTLLKEMDDKKGLDEYEFLNLSSSTSVTGIEMNMTNPTSHQSEFDESISSTLEISNMSYSTKERSTIVNDFNSRMFNTSHNVNELGKIISTSGNLSSKINTFDFIKHNGKRTGEPKAIKDHFLNALENNTDPFTGNSFVNSSDSAFNDTKITFKEQYTWTENIPSRFTGGSKEASSFIGLETKEIRSQFDLENNMERSVPKWNLPTTKTQHSNVTEEDFKHFQTTILMSPYESTSEENKSLIKQFSTIVVPTMFEMNDTLDTDHTLTVDPSTNSYRKNETKKHSSSLPINSNELLISVEDLNEIDHQQSFLGAKTELLKNRTPGLNTLGMDDKKGLDKREFLNLSSSTSVTGMEMNMTDPTSLQSEFDESISSTLEISNMSNSTKERSTIVNDINSRMFNTSHKFNELWKIIFPSENLSSKIITFDFIKDNGKRKGEPKDIKDHFLNALENNTDPFTGNSFVNSSDSAFNDTKITFKEQYPWTENIPSGFTGDSKEASSFIGLETKGFRSQFDLENNMERSVPKWNLPTTKTQQSNVTEEDFKHFQTTILMSPYESTSEENKSLIKQFSTIMAPTMFEMNDTLNTDHTLTVDPSTNSYRKNETKKHSSSLPINSNELLISVEDLNEIDHQQSFLGAKTELLKNRTPGLKTLGMDDKKGLDKREFLNLSSSTSVTGMEMNMTDPTSLQSEFDESISSTLEISNMSNSTKERSTIVNDINSRMFNTSHKLNELGKIISPSENVSPKINTFDFIKDNGKRTGKTKDITDHFLNALENKAEPFIGNSFVNSSDSSDSTFNDIKITFKKQYPWIENIPSSFTGDSKEASSFIGLETKGFRSQFDLENNMERSVPKWNLPTTKTQHSNVTEEDFKNFQTTILISPNNFVSEENNSLIKQFSTIVVPTIFEMNYTLGTDHTLRVDPSTNGFNKNETKKYSNSLSINGNELLTSVEALNEIDRQQSFLRGKPKLLKNRTPGLNAVEMDDKKGLVKHEFLNLSSSTSVTGMKMNITDSTSHDSEFDDPISSTLEISNMSHSIKELSTVANDINSTMFNISHQVNELGKMISHIHQVKVESKTSNIKDSEDGNIGEFTKQIQRDQKSGKNLIYFKLLKILTKMLENEHAAKSDDSTMNRKLEENLGEVVKIQTPLVNLHVLGHQNKPINNILVYVDRNVKPKNMEQKFWNENSQSLLNEKKSFSRKHSNKIPHVYSSIRIEYNEYKSDRYAEEVDKGDLMNSEVEYSLNDGTNQLVEEKRSEEKD